jgi:hypothetical protein
LPTADFDAVSGSTTANLRTSLRQLKFGWSREREEILKLAQEMVCKHVQFEDYFCTGKRTIVRAATKYWAQAVTEGGHLAAPDEDKEMPNQEELNGLVRAMFSHGEILT